MGGATVTVTLDKPMTQTVTPCVENPDRWADGGNDPALKALCRSCPRRWLCAHEALKTPGIEGMIAAAPELTYAPLENMSTTLEFAPV